jgi:NADPH2:quinone reductase
MKALIANDYGPPAQLTVAEVSDPKPVRGQVLVAIEAAALNPFDLKLVTGATGESSEIQFPYIPGMDGAGTVAAVGEGVTRFAGGEQVFGFFGQTPGTIAEHAVITDGPYLAARPVGLDAVRAAAIPESGLTATSLVRAARLKAGQSVLVVGASGGIGMFVLQLAAGAGAVVLGTAIAEDSEYVRGLGATETLDYRASDIIAETLRIHPDGVDVVFDLVNAGPTLAGSARAVRPGGQLISPLGGPDAAALERESITVTYTGLSATREAGDLDDLGARVAAGSLTVEIGGVYELEDAPQAFVDFAERHTRGKLVVTT